jgi:ABC-type bacteriocin/lantibiotic exporter with double-glycine peptidase domain
MKDVVLRYREGLPAVLKNLSLNIQGGERIGIGITLPREMGTNE